MAENEAIRKLEKAEDKVFTATNGGPTMTVEELDYKKAFDKDLAEMAKIHHLKVMERKKNE
jgi:hypothetical protein